MATSDRDLIVRIDAETRALKSKLDAASNDVAKFGSGVQGTLSRMEGGFSKFGTALGALGVAMGARWLKNFTADALESIGGLGELSAQLGITTETFQTLTFAGLQFGVAQGEIEGIVGKFTKALGNAAEGNKGAIETFERLGVKILDAGGNLRSTDAVLLETVDAISKIDDPARRASIGAELMGKSFQKLLPLVEGGAAGFEDMRIKAHELGLIFSDEVIANADAASDSLAVMSTVLKAQLAQILIQIAPLLTAAAQGILSVLQASNKFFGGLEAEKTRKDLDTVNEALVVTEGKLKDLREGTIAGFFGNLGGADEAFQLERYNELLAKRNTLLGKTGTRDKDDEFILPVVATPGVSNPTPSGGGGKKSGGSGGASEAERAAKKYEAALDSIRQKIAETKSDIAGDPLGKLLAQNFDQAGLALDDYGAKAEELRAATELQYEGMTELAIGVEAVAAAHAADSEASAEWNAIQEEGRSIMEGLRTPMEDYTASLERASFLLSQGAINQETYTRLIDQAGDAFVAADEQAQLLITSAGEVGTTLVNAFGKAAFAGASLKDVLREVLLSLANVAAQAAGGGIESLIGGLFKSVLPMATGALSPSPTGARAGGGPVSAGVPYTVGEHGPETFIPRTPGHIIANGGGGRGGGNVVNLSVSVNSNGGTPAQNADNAQRLSQAFHTATTAALKEALQTEKRDRGMLARSVV